MFFFNRKRQGFLLINIANLDYGIKYLSILHNVGFKVYAYQTRENVTIHKYK